MEREILLRRDKLPTTNDPEKLMEYLLRSLGIERNINAYRRILEKVYRDSLTTGEISSGIAKRTTTIYYVKKLVRIGLIVKRGSRYELREHTLENTMREIKKDVDRILDDLILIAKKIDEVVRV